MRGGLLAAGKQSLHLAVDFQCAFCYVMYLQVDGLQQQLLGMQKQQQQQSHEPADAVSQAVIASLRASVNQVSTMASSVSQENKALASDNKRLSHQRDQLNNTIKQLQVWRRIAAWRVWNDRACVGLPIASCPYTIQPYNNTMCTVNHSI